MPVDIIGAQQKVIPAITRWNVWTKLVSI